MSNVCSDRFLDFMASPTALLIVCRVITFFELPLHAYGAYCIIKKNPKQMARVKKSMLIMHITTVIQNVSNSFLVIPFAMLPAMAGIPLGFLTKMFGVPVEYQVYLVVTSVSVASVSILSVYENRYTVLYNNQNWKKFRKLYIILNYFSALICMVYPVYQVPEQYPAQQQLIKDYPCIIQESGLDPDKVFVMTYNAATVAGPMLIDGCVVFSQFFVFAILTYKFFLKKRYGTSSNTFQMQRKFMIALVVQTILVVIVLIAPVYVFTLSMFSDSYDQGLNNLCVMILSMNASISTTAMIFLHPPYRQFTVYLFTRPFKKCSNPNSSVNSAIFNDRF